MTTNRNITDREYSHTFVVCHIIFSNKRHLQRKHGTDLKLNERMSNVLQPRFGFKMSILNKQKSKKIGKARIVKRVARLATKVPLL